jgi:hypothetical protein
MGGRLRGLEVQAADLLYLDALRGSIAMHAAHHHRTLPHQER